MSAARGDQVHGITPRQIVALLSILLVGIVLRSILLEKESLWFDEVFSIRLALQDLSSVLQAERRNPPLHFLLLHFWMKAFGDSAAAARSLSVVVGSVSIFLAFALGRRFYGTYVGLAAALFTALSSFQIYYAQEARTFALVLMLLLASSLLMDIFLRSSSQRVLVLAGIGYVATSALACYCHFYTPFYIFAQNVFFVLFWKDHRHRLVPWIVVQILILLLFAPWLAVMLSEAAAGEGLGDRRHFLLKVPQSLFSMLATDTLIPLDERAVNDVRGTLVSHAPALISSTLVFAALGLLALLQTKRFPRGHALMLCLGLLPLLLSFVISFKLMILEERYLIGSSVPLYLFVLSPLPTALMEWRGWPRIGAVALALGVSVLSFVALYNYYFNPRFGRDQWREATQWVEERAQPDDVIVFLPEHIGICFEYYARQSHPTLRVRRLVFDPATDWWRSFLEQLRSYKSGWIVRSRYADESVVEGLAEYFVVREAMEFPRDKGIIIYRVVVEEP